MNYSAVYNKCIKYGRAPKEAIADFVEQQKQNGSISKNNSSDHVFADFLEDHDDPRHEIVRRDLQLRPDTNDKFEADKQFSDNVIKDKSSRFGEEAYSSYYPSIKTEDGTIEVSPIVDSEHSRGSNILGHELIWRPHNKKGQEMWDTGYIGHFSPDEFDNMMEKLNLPYSTNIIKEHLNR